MGLIIARGATAEFTQPLPFGVEEIAEARLTIKQGEQEIIHRSLAELQAEGKSVTVALSQEDTLQFTAGMPALIEIRLRLQSGSACTTGIRGIEVLDTLYEGVV